LIPLKQYAIFIEVIAEIKKNYSHGSKAVLIGDGPEKEKLVGVGLHHRVSNRTFY